MDRDKRWERVQKAYDVMCRASGGEAKWAGEYDKEVKAYDVEAGKVKDLIEAMHGQNMTRAPRTAGGARLRGTFSEPSCRAKDDGRVHRAHGRGCLGRSPPSLSGVHPDPPRPACRGVPRRRHRGWRRLRLLQLSRGPSEGDVRVSRRSCSSVHALSSPTRVHSTPHACRHTLVDTRLQTHVCRQCCRAPTCFVTALAGTRLPGSDMRADTLADTCRRDCADTRLPTHACHRARRHAHADKVCRHAPACTVPRRCIAVKPLFDSAVERKPGSAVSRSRLSGDCDDPRQPGARHDHLDDEALGAVCRPRHPDHLPSGLVIQRAERDGVEARVDAVPLTRTLKEWRLTSRPFVLRLTQFHSAETEKFAHVTFFFNGGREAPFEGEVRQLEDSPKVGERERAAPGTTFNRSLSARSCRRHCSG